MDISQYLHFVDNATLALPGTPQYDHLGKVKPILEFLNNKFLTLYNPNRDNSIDETMIKIKGRSAMKQYAPKDPIKRGFKVWVRADSDNGFVCEYQVYCGKEKRSETGLGSLVVRDLTRTIVRKNHYIYCDNFFTDIPPFKDLLEDKIYACGTMCSDRKFYPTEFKPILKKGFKERGEFKLLQHESLLMTVWQDTKVVSALATKFQPLAITQVERKQQNREKRLVNCPQLIAKYNQKMGGVDRNDQLRQYYFLNSRGYKAYMYILYFVTDVVITNTYLLQTFLPTFPFKMIKDFCLKLDHLLIGSQLWS